MKFLNNVFAAAEEALHPVSPKNDSAKSLAVPADLKRISTNETECSSYVNSPEHLTTMGPYSRDFDENPTELYRFIQMKRWSRVLEALEESPEDAKVWVFRLNEDHLSVRWRLLPLHAALILRAPDDVIEALLKAFHYSANMKDDQGSLPLHLICKVGASPRVAEMLLTVYPKAATQKDKNGRTPSVVLALFNPPNKTEILALINKRVDEELEAKAALEAFERRGESKPVSLESMSIEVPQKEIADVLSKTSGLTAIIMETREPEPEETRETVTKPELLLNNVQEKHKERLIAMKESMDIQNEVAKAGEDMSLQVKLEDAQSEHLKELLELKEEADRRYQEAREKEAAMLQAQLEKAKAKHEAELMEIQMSMTEVEAKGNHEDELLKIQKEIESLRKQHEKEIKMIKEAAENEREIARREEREMFELRLKQFEEKHQHIMEGIKAESLAEREKARLIEAKNFEQKVEIIEKKHQKELKTVEARLMAERETMQEDQRKLFDKQIAEMQARHENDINEFQAKLNVAKEIAREERSHVLDSMLHDLQMKHLANLEQIEKKSNATISGLEAIIESLKEDLAKASASSNKQNQGFSKTLQGLEAQLKQNNDKASKKVNLLERTVESLEASLLKARKHSIFLEDHVQNLEEQLEEVLERHVKDREIEARLDKLHRSWFCFDF